MELFVKICAKAPSYVFDRDLNKSLVKFLRIFLTTLSLKSETFADVLNYSHSRCANFLSFIHKLRLFLFKVPFVSVIYCFKFLIVISITYNKSFFNSRKYLCLLLSEVFFPLTQTFFSLLVCLFVKVIYCFQFINCGISRI